MKYDNIMVYLEKLRQFCFMDGEHLLKVPMEDDWNMKHLEESLSEALDIIFDYENATSQAARLMEKYETPKDVIRRPNGMFDTWQCPDCMNFVAYGNEHCHWCGRMLGWDIRKKKRRKR